MERLIMLTGKGGVGKTSIAAAHAVKSASQGKRTLLASLDAAHNLSDLFDCPPAPEPRQVTDHLDICEVDANRVRAEDFPDMNEMLMRRLLAGDADDAGPQEVVDIPGLEPMLFLLKVQQLIDEGGYDRVILDLAPTGETLSLLQLPEQLRWWMERIFPLEKVALRVLRPVAKKFYKLELPDKQTMNDIEQFYFRLAQMQELLKDPALTSVRIVTQPEQMVVDETRRAYAHLNLFGYAVDHIFVNGVYPPDQVGDFFKAWVEHQQKHLLVIDETFPHLPVTKIARLPADLTGLDDVRQLTELAIGEDAFEVHEGIAREEYVREGEAILLNLLVPLTDPDDLRLSLSASDLVLRFGNLQRNIPLPDTLRAYEVAGARAADGLLTITFRPSQQESA